jgi:DNA-binding NarL/FixJ family response regulator
MHSLEVFLADDHAVVREGLKKLLSETPGMAVVGEASDGKTACHDASALKPDVTVMDISMPVLNGIEATKRLKLLCPSTKILILTVHDEVDYLREVMQAGASGLVLKQAAGDELIRAINLVATGGTYIDPHLAAELLSRSKDGTSRSRWGVELSAREEAVVRLVAEGHSNKEIAKQLHVSIKSVETYKSRSMAKLGFQGRTDFVRFALQKGWLKRGADGDEA